MSGRRLKESLKSEKPLQMVGVINAMTALLAKSSGFQALYLSGAGVANACFGLPDLGMTSLTEVVEETRRITSCVDLPLLVDGDTGFGSVLNVARTIQDLSRAGAAGVQLEDQTFPKRCGHREGKRLVSSTEMVDRLKAAVDARVDPDFVIMARTDSQAEEGIEKAVERSLQYQAAGADMIFAEAVKDLAHYRAFTEALKIPVLANITEFGKTPLFTVEELKSVNIAIALYPLSAFRAMNLAAKKVFETIKNEGTQKNMLNEMQTREELYNLLDYYSYEKKI